MVEIGVRELKRDLSGYLKRAAAGEAIRVTMRGKPVVDLTPVAEPSGKVDAFEAELAYLESVGKVTRATRPKGKVVQLDFAYEGSLSDEILRDRAKEDER